ncbi:hypothetical protein KSP40_PGU002912 [Platanthera guangdongensis]|uniref:Uncharacterized protein n=1 Tax=Platanthera guangdongensis TaxID=2320717 RepID=A0ABR2MFK4_9ASPA
MLAEVSNSWNVSPGKYFNAGRGRDSRYGSRLFSQGHANRYHSPISLQHSSSRRQHSFSPHRRPPHLARKHTRSPSRSRTRSPHTRTSPRGRIDRRISAIHNVKRQSRSTLILSLKEGYLDRGHHNITVFLLKTFLVMLMYPDDILLQRRPSRLVVFGGGGGINTSFCY